MAHNPGGAAGSSHPSLHSTYGSNGGIHTPPSTMSPHLSGIGAATGAAPGYASGAAGGGPAPPPPFHSSAYGHPSGAYSPNHQYQMSGTRTPSGGRHITSLSPMDIARAAQMAGTQRMAEARASNIEEEEEDEDEEDDEDEDDEDDEDDDEEEDEEDSSMVDGSQKRKRDSSIARAGPSDKRQNGSKGATASGSGKGGSKSSTASRQAGADGKKAKPTRGAKACRNCRRLKMRCVGAENGPPCNRCRHSGHDCVFEESNRGKKGNKTQRTEAMAQSLKKMEATLANVLRSIRDPGIAAQLGGMATRSPSPIENASKGLIYPHQRDGTRTPEHLKSRPEPKSEELREFVKDYEDNHDVDKFGIAYAKGKGRATDSAPAREASVAASPAYALDPAILGQSTAPATAHAGSNPAGSPTEESVAGAPASSAGRSPAPNANGSLAPAQPSTGTRFVEPMPRYHRGEQRKPQRENIGRFRSSSPRLHALPDNTLNPLGLLAEASLHNSHKAKKVQSRNRSNSNSTTSNTNKEGMSPATEKKDVEEATPSSKGGKRGPGAGAKGVAMEASSSSVPLGVANETYFKPGPMTILPLRQIIIERELPVEILTLGIVSSEEVLDLFKIFFHSCMQHVFMLDPDWHTPTFLCGRSPFLFTCVCTVAAKFYTRRPDLHAKCFTYAKKCAFEIMDRGYKSVEIVQGFLLLSLWCHPAERYEQDTAWLFSGVAIRIATDLNLHRKSLASLPGRPEPDDPAVLDREREIINRERTWYICYVVDRNLSGQMGKPYTIREDWLIRNCRHWCLQRLSKPWDVGISALVELLRIQSRQIDFLYSSTASVSGLNMDIDYPSVLRVFNEQLDEWRELWRYRGLFQVQSTVKKRGQSTSEAQDGATGGGVSQPTQGSTSDAPAGHQKDRTNAVVDQMLGNEAPPDDADHTERTMYFLVRQAPIRFNYAVLILNSFGLQHALDHPTLTGLDKPQYYMRCLTAARGIVDAAFAMGPVLRYAPDSQFVMIAYACVFLLKLVRPAFANLTDEEAVVQTVSKTADLLEQGSVNESHTPALYATFLRTLLQSRLERTSGSKSGANTPHRASSRVGSPSGDAEQIDMRTALNTGLNADPPTESSLRGLSVSGGITMMPGGRDDVAINTMHGLDATQMLNAVNANTDQLLNESFWSSLLPPGFGGPLDGTGSNMLDGMPATSIFRNHQQSFGATPGQTPGQTRPSTPSMMHSFPAGLDLHFHS